MWKIFEYYVKNAEWDWSFIWSLISSTKRISGKETKTTFFSHKERFYILPADYLMTFFNKRLFAYEDNRRLFRIVEDYSNTKTF